LKNVAFGKETFAAQGWHRLGAIKAGRRKLSRKKTGKTLLLSGKVPVHIPVSGRRGVRRSRHVAQTSAFFTASVALQRLAEI
jgi:hypothetical protein